MIAQLRQFKTHHLQNIFSAYLCAGLKEKKPLQINKNSNKLPPKLVYPFRLKNSFSYTLLQISYFPPDQPPKGFSKCKKLIIFANLKHKVLKFKKCYSFQGKKPGKCDQKFREIIFFKSRDNHVDALYNVKKN